MKMKKELDIGCLSKFDHFLIKTFMGGHAEASSYSKLSLILVHEEFCSPLPSIFLKIFQI